MIPRMGLRALLILVVAVMLTSSCLAQGERKTWHEPTGVSVAPPSADPQSPAYRPFDQYVTWVTGQLDAALQKARPDLSAADRNRIVEMRAPFEWPPDPAAWGANSRPCPAPQGGPRSGILLIHGLTDSPFLMRDVGRSLRETKCFRVRAILLPGHGTVQGDLLEVTYRDWIEAARYGINSFAGEVDELYVAGFSTGGALAVYHALGQGEPAQTQPRPPIKALLLFSPAIKVADPKAPLANWHKIYSWAIPRGDWLGNLSDEHDAVKYESFPKNAGDQVYLLTKAVAERMQRGRLDIPVFIALSQDDATVNSRATIEFFTTITRSPTSKNVLVAYTKVPEAIGDGAPIRDRRSVYPGEGIVAFSHVAIPVHPDNPHYGRRGTYKSCLEYEKSNSEGAADAQACPAMAEQKTNPGTTTAKDARTTAKDNRWCRCRTAQPPADGVRLGETSGSELKLLDEASTLKDLHPPLVMRRLTFNPDFEGMMKEIDRFVEQVQKSAP
jgi:esterase/lipase